MSGILLDADRQPGYLWLPEDARMGDDSASDLMAECGMPMDPWQQFVLRCLTATKPSGLWAGREAGLVVPRQNGKSVILAALALHGLVITDTPLQLWSAHQFRTARESFRLITQLFDGSAFLRKRLKTIRASHGEETVEMRNGYRLQFIARIRTSGRGFSGDRLLLDEAMELGSEQVASLLPTMAARPNPQALYAASAGLLSTDHLRTVRDRGRKGGGRSLVWVEYAARPAPSGKGNYTVEYEGRKVAYNLDSRAEILRANPALGTRLTEEHIEMERSSMSDEDFARERLGIWTDPPGEEVVERAFTPAEWDACKGKERPTRYAVRVLAVDVGPNSESASIVGAFPLASGKTYVSRVETRAGTRWLVDYLSDLCERLDVEQLIIDGIGASAAVIPDLRDALNVPIKVLSTKEVVESCLNIQKGVVGKQLVHSGDQGLNDAQLNARKRQIGDTGWGWRRSDAEGDITALVAATFAYSGVQRFVRIDDTERGRDEEGSEFG